MKLNLQKMFLLVLFHLALTSALYFDDLDLTVPDPTRFISYYGPGAGYQFGNVVKTLGDINGDGIKDFIIGAPSASGLASLAFVIYGQKNGLLDIDFSAMTSTQGFRIQSDTIGDLLGGGVDSAGDFNGDGIQDFAIGAPLDPAGGVVYVIFGSKTPFPNLNLPSGLPGRGFKISGIQPGGMLGNAVNCLGDVNGDGLDDLIIAAYQEYIGSTAGSTTGSVYVIFGRKTGIIDLTVPTDLTSDRGFYLYGNVGDGFGYNAGPAGDINADGIQDIIVGAFHNGLESEAYIIFGRKTAFQNYNLALAYSSTEINKIEAANAADWLGTASGKAGDVNGDGIDDLVIGASRVSVPGKVYVGAVYVLFGRKNGIFNMNMATDMDNTKGFVIYGANSVDVIGGVVTRAGDFNGDGIDDISFGGSSATVGGILNAGLAYVIYGRKTGIKDIYIADGLDKTDGFMIPGTSYLGQLGSSMSGGVDVNGDGGPDLILGAMGNNNPAGVQTGAAFVLFGIPPPPKSTSTIDTIVKAQSAGALANQAAALVLFFGQANNGLPLLFTFLVEVLYYVRYLEINYPPRLKYMLEQPDPDYLSVDYITSAPEQLEDYLPSYDIPYKFEFFGFDSSFLVNFWPSIIMFFIVMAIIIIALLLEYATRSKKWLNNLCLQFKRSMKWNYLIAMFTGYYNDIALHTFFETRIIKIDSFLSGLSFVVCILMNALAGFMLIKLFLIIRQVRAKTDQVRVNKTSTPEELDKFKEDLKDYEVIFNGYKSNDFLQQSYLLLLSLRLYIFYVIVGYAFAHPIVQTSIITVMGFITLAYIIFKRPFEDKKDFIMSIVQETILQIVNISAFVLAVTDGEDKETDGVRIFFGDVIIGCNIAFMIVGLTYTAVMMTLFLADCYKYVKSKCTQKQKRSPPRNYKPRKRNISNTVRERSGVNESQYDLNINESSFIDQVSAYHNKSDMHLTEIHPFEAMRSPPKKNFHRPRPGPTLHPTKSNVTAQSNSDQQTSPERRREYDEPADSSNLDVLNYDQRNRIPAKNVSPFARRDKTVHKYH